MKFPVALYHPEAKNQDKVIHAMSELELQVLMRLGWKVKEH